MMLMSAQDGGIDVLSDSSQGMEALDWPSLRADKPSAWHGHVSFGHWLIQIARPNCVVELGSHNGVSYAAFCNAVARCNLPSRCYAVDTWQGDAHTGNYGEDVYQNLLQFNSEHYAEFSILMRCYFDDALEKFDNGSVDILHIDGLHTYEAVKHDFYTWLPKLSERAVVLFHDTEIYHADFGVWKFWTELCENYPHFNFLHSAGLGVLLVGEHHPDALQALCAAMPAGAVNPAGERFAVASDRAYQSGLSLLNRAASHVADNPTSADRNIALNCLALQSSVFMNGEPTANGAVNGLKTGQFGFHTALEVNPWWMVDLGSPQALREIVIYNRLDEPCKDRSRTLSILVSEDAEAWQTLYVHDGSSFGGADGFPLRVPCAGKIARFVRIKLNERQYLHFDEVEVFGVV